MKSPPSSHRRPPTHWPIVLALIVVLHLAVNTAGAQHVTGDLQLIVADSLGEPLPGVNAVVTGPNVQGDRGAASDNLGYCNVLTLPPGVVTIRLSHAAFQPVVIDNILIQLGKTTHLGEIRLRQRTHDMPELVISGLRPGIDPRSTTYGSNLRPSDFENLPVDRNYRGMVSLLPQANTSYYGDEVNIAGATGFENKYVVDGTEVTDPLIGGNGTNLPYNFIQEVEVKAGGYEADSRSSLGGVLNVVTYSGTNELHGSAFGFYTSNRFASQRRVGLSDPTQGGFSNYDVGFGIGGPIIRDQLWFFGAYNPTYERRDVDVPGYGISVDRASTNSFAAKLTWSASERLRLILAATGDPSTEQAVGYGVGVPSGLASTDSYFMIIGAGGTNYSLHGTYTFMQNLVVDGSLSRVNYHATGDPATDLGSQETFFFNHLDNVQSGGPPSRWDSFRSATAAKVWASMIAEAHTMKLGLEYKVNGTDNRYMNHTIDMWDDTTFQEQVSRGYETVHDDLLSLFAQDTWQVLRNVSIHAGIRWDGQTIVGSNGAVAQKVTTPLEPRIGFTYLAGDEGLQKIYGSYGRFSQEFALFQPMNMFSDQGYAYNTYFRQDPQVSSTGGYTVPGSGTFTIKPGVQGLRGQYFDEFSLGYERAFAWGLRVGLQGLYRTLRVAIDDVYDASEAIWRFGNPGRGSLSDWPSPQRDYTALIITLERHDDERFNFFASYVLSRDYGNYPGVFDAVTHGSFPNFGTTFDNLNSTKQFGTGLLPNDRTHTVKFSGSYRILSELSAGITFVAQGGSPLSEFQFQDPGLLTWLAPRGSAGRTPTIWDLSARVVYGLRFVDIWRSRLVLDIFHIASQRKPVDIDKNHGYLDAFGNFYANPTYGQAFRYLPPMSVRLGMEVSF